jgi:hypothetical protein
LKIITFRTIPESEKALEKIMGNKREDFIMYSRTDACNEALIAYAKALEEKSTKQK